MALCVPPRGILGDVHASRGPVGAVLRFLGAVLATSGVLLLADAGLTLAWQEPLTALSAARAQSELDDQLGGQRRLARADERALTTVRDPRRRLAALAAKARERARGKKVAIGRVQLPTLGRSYAIVQGTDTATLRRGPGHYPGSPFPGQRGTVAIAGHRTTYGAPFRTIDKLDRGDRIVLAMPYGRLMYTVTSTRIVLPTNLSVLKRVGYDQLLLTACHPLYSAARRIAVFARLRSFAPGPRSPSPSPATRRLARTATTARR